MFEAAGPHQPARTRQARRSLGPHSCRGLSFGRQPPRSESVCRRRIASACHASRKQRLVIGQGRRPGMSCSPARALDLGTPRRRGPSRKQPPARRRWAALAGGPQRRGEYRAAGYRAALRQAPPPTALRREPATLAPDQGLAGWVKPRPRWWCRGLGRPAGVLENLRQRHGGDLWPAAGPRRRRSPHRPTSGP